MAGPEEQYYSQLPFIKSDSSDNLRYVTQTDMDFIGSRWLERAGCGAQIMQVWLCGSSLFCITVSLSTQDNGCTVPFCQ
jgi:hypothetical protein